MRRLLGSSLVVLALAAPLAACGSDDTAADPAPPAATSTSASPGTDPAPGPGWQVQIISATAAGGKTSGTATPIDTPAALAAYARQFRSPAVKAQLEKATRGLDAEQVLAAVVGLGCDVPPDAAVEDDGATVTVVPGDVVSPLPECLAPVTSIAVVSR